MNLRSLTTALINPRLEDERKEVREMRQDMEALQAAVVAQTASLTIKQSPSVRGWELPGEFLLTPVSRRKLPA